MYNIVSYIQGIISIINVDERADIYEIYLFDMFPYCTRVGHEYNPKVYKWKWFSLLNNLD